MARMDLSGWTLEEKKAWKALQADARKKKQRAKDKKEREMAKTKAMLTPASPEVVEFLELVEGYRLRALVEAVAIWQREYKQPLPLEPFAGVIAGQSSEEYWARKNRSRNLELAKMFAQDFYAREKAAERKKVFDAKEAHEAKRLGISVFEMQKRRKIAKAIDAKKARAAERFTDKAAA